MGVLLSGIFAKGMQKGKTGDRSHFGIPTPAPCDIVKFLQRLLEGASFKCKQKQCDKFYRLFLHRKGVNAKIT